MLPPLFQDDTAKIRNKIESRIFIHDFFYKDMKKAFMTYVLNYLNSLSGATDRQAY